MSEKDGNIQELAQAGERWTVDGHQTKMKDSDEIIARILAACRTFPEIDAKVEALTVGSLFSGIGGLDLGLERAGMKIIWQVEKDEFCRQVLRKHWPDVRQHDDVRTWPVADTEPVDLICGGFPCQPVSQAGLKLAQDDERWLWPEYYRIICALRPRYALVENVPGLLVRGIGDVIRDLAQSGYHAEWDCLAAGYFGAPHLRERIFILAYSNEEHGTERMGTFENRQGTIFAGRDTESFPIWLQAANRFVGVDDGIPAAVYKDEGGAYGNAVVPQVAEWIGNRIMEYEKESRERWIIKPPQPGLVRGQLEPIRDMPWPKQGEY